MLDCSPYVPIKKSLPLLRFSWSRCQYEDQSSANQLVFPCSSQENLTSAEQQESEVIEDVEEQAPRGYQLTH